LDKDEKIARIRIWPIGRRGSNRKGRGTRAWEKSERGFGGSARKNARIKNTKSYMRKRREGGGGGGCSEKADFRNIKDEEKVRIGSRISKWIKVHTWKS